MFTLLGHVPWLAGFLAMVPSIARGLDNSRRAHFDKATARKGKGTGVKDLFYHLVSDFYPLFHRRNLRLTKPSSQSDEAGTEKERVPFDVVVSDASLTVFAGSDTSKAALSSLFFYLLCNVEKLDKLREEIDRFYPPGKSLSSERFHEMSYLDACINEALRLSPPVPSGSQRDAGPDANPSKGRTFGP